MEKVSFDNLVNKAILELPPKIRQKMDNVEIVIEDKANAWQIRKAGLKPGSSLLGLYQGVPQTAWGRGFGNILPDKITIFKKTIEQFAQSEREIIELVKETVWHEIAHHFGFSEEGVRQLKKERMSRQASSR